MHLICQSSLKTKKAKTQNIPEVLVQNNSMKDKNTKSKQHKILMIKQKNTLLGTNISHPKALSKMIFLFPFGGMCGGSVFFWDPRCLGSRCKCLGSNDMIPGKKF